MRRNKKKNKSGGAVLPSPAFPFERFNRNLHLGVSNVFIDHCLYRTIPNFFAGTWPCDTAPYGKCFSNPLPNAMVINQSPSGQPGTHFISLLSTSTTVYYFDSTANFLLSPSLRKGLALLRGMNKKRKKKKLVFTPSSAFQAPSSRFCGIFCIKFLLHCSLLFSSTTDKNLARDEGRRGDEIGLVRSVHDCYFFPPLVNCAITIKSA